MALGVTAAAYARAVAALDSVAWRGIMPGLERTRALLATLGNPHIGLRGALVAGTNGKGSVCTTVDSVCRAAGYRSVLLTSPHLISYCERIVRDGSPITESEFGALIARVGAAAEALPEELQPTGFEVLTAAGILVAREADAEVLVCEVGLGGRLDSTNVLDLGVATVTNVALDHQDLLGETIPEIAREKAAIIKPGNRAVTAATEPGLTAVRAQAAEVGASLSVVGIDVPFTGHSTGMRGVAVDTLFDGRPVSLQTPLRGVFQVANIATAVAVCDALRATGIAIDAGAVVRGCESVRWSGRMDWIDGEPPLLIDGAHNPAGMAAMVSSARELIGGRRCVAVFGAMRNKDVRSMAARLAELTREIVVTAPAVERATPPADLARLFDPPAEVAAGVRTALHRARHRAGREGVVVVCGSLYLAGEVLELLRV